MTIHSPLTPFTSKSIKLSPSKEELKSIIQEQNKEIKTLKEKVKYSFESIFNRPLVTFEQKRTEILENIKKIDVFTTSSKINISFHQNDGFK